MGREQVGKIGIKMELGREGSKERVPGVEKGG